MASGWERRGADGHRCHLRRPLIGSIQGSSGASSKEITDKNKYNIFKNLMAKFLNINLKINSFVILTINIEIDIYNVLNFINGYKFTYNIEKNEILRKELNKGESTQRRLCVIQV